MAAGSTYIPIATNTLGTAIPTVTFSSISGSYTDLVLVASVKGTAVEGYFSMQFNGDTATNYSTTQLGGTGSSPFSQRTINVSNPDFADYMLTTNFQNFTFNIMNYSNTTTYKTSLLREGNGGNGYVIAAAFLWRSTSAITSIAINNLGGGNFAVGSTFTLYGIAAA